MRARCGYSPEVAEHEFVSPYSEKGKVTQTDLDRLVPVTDHDVANTATWSLADMDDAAVSRVRHFVGAVWPFMTTSLAA